MDSVTKHPLPPHPVTFPPTFCLADDYLATSEQAQDKSDRTRLRVLGLTAQLLDRSPSAQLTPGGVAELAGISRPLMYHYFGDVAGLLAAIMGDFEQRTVETVRRVFAVSGRYSYAHLVGYLAWVLAVVLRNPGAFRMMHSQSDNLPGVKAAYNRLNYELNRSLGEHLMPPSHMAIGPDERLLMGYMVAEGFNSLLRELFVYPNDHLPRLSTPESLLNLVQLVAGHRHRLIHGTDPLPGEVRAVTEGFDLTFFDDCFGGQNPTKTRVTSEARSRAGTRRRA